MPVSRRLSLVCALLVLALCCLGFTYPKPGEDDSGRSLSAMSKDQALANAIKGKLLDKDKTQALKVRVACFDGRAFLVGRPSDLGFQSFAVNAARETKGVQQVTAVFQEDPSSEEKDQEIAARLRTALAADPALESLHLEAEVLDGVAVLLGRVPNPRAGRQAEAAAKSVAGVKRVRSFLIPGK